MSTRWDASTYARASDAQARWAEAVLDRLSLRGDETVLDAGCGSGGVTLRLAERLPRGRVIAVDGSEDMVALARETLAGTGAEVRLADLASLDLGEPVDAIFSNAVFHWIADHERLFRRLFAALRPGGVLVAQCGGEGNVERFHAAASAAGAREPFAAHFGGWLGPWNFAGADETAARLERAGFERVETWLEPYPIEPDEPADYLRSVCLGYHLERLPQELRAPYVEAVLDELGDGFALDYVRLNIDARRPL